MPALKNKLQFLVVLALFLPTVIGTLSKQTGITSAADELGILLPISFLVIVYLLFEIGPALDSSSEKLIGYILNSTVALYVPVFAIISFSPNVTASNNIVEYIFGISFLGIIYLPILIPIIYFLRFSFFPDAVTIVNFLRKTCYARVMSNKVILTVLAAVGGLFLVTLLVRGTLIPPKNLVTPGTQPDTPISLDTPPPAGPVVLVGEGVCLPHKGNPEITTMECAYGFQDDQGRFFALRDVSPELTTIAQLVMGVPTRITGTFYPHRDTKYEGVGIVEVTKIERIEIPRTEDVTLSGTFNCLPHKDTTGPQTEECAFGFTTDDGINYALNFGQSSTMASQFQSGMHGTYSGFVTPIETLSSDQWQKYDIAGIFTIHQQSPAVAL
jgi:hypothetical protein